MDCINHYTEQAQAWYANNIQPTLTSLYDGASNVCQKIYDYVISFFSQLFTSKENAQTQTDGRKITIEIYPECQPPQLLVVVERDPKFVYDNVDDVDNKLPEWNIQELALAYGEEPISDV